MKKIFILITFACSTAVCSNLYAQQVTPPAVSGDKDLRDTNVRTRSIDLERVERDARKNSKSKGTQAAAAKAEEDKLAARYAEIKEDFEQIQKAQDSIVKAYQGTGKIDYALIGKSALGINNSAKRLDSNLFPILLAAKAEAKKEDKKEETAKKEMKPAAKSVRDLIIDLDDAIAVFVTSPIFQNLRTVDTAVAEKAKLDLEKIIELSAALNAQSAVATGSEK